MPIFYKNGSGIYYRNGTGLTNLSYIDSDDEESAYPAVLTRQVNRLETPYRYDPDPNNIMGDWYRYLVNELYGMPKKEEIMKTVPITYQNEYDRIGRMAELLKIGTRVRVINTENRNLWLRAGTVIGKAGLDEYDVKIDEYKGYTSDGVFRFSSHQIEILDTDSDYPMSITYDNRNFYKAIVNTFYGRRNSKEETMKTVPTYAVKKIIYNPPATIVFWEDGSKTVVKCSKDDEYSPYFGFLAALAKKVYGNPSRVRKIVDKWAPEEEEQLNDIAKAFKAATESIQSLAERFNKATNDKE